MKKVITAEYEVKRKSLLPIRVMAHSGVDNIDLLLKDNPKCVPFKIGPCAVFEKRVHLFFWISAKKYAEESV